MELVFLLQGMKGSFMKFVLKIVKLVCTETARASAVIMVIKIVAIIAGRNLEGSVLQAFIGLTFLLIPASAIVNFVNRKIGEFLKD